MDAIENSLRDAIRSANADTAEKRNSIYIAARNAVDQLPSAQGEIANAKLVAAVERIEREFSPDRFDAVSEPSVVSSIEDHEQSERASVRQSMPWGRFGLALIVLAFIAFSSQLVWRQYSQTEAVEGDVPETIKYGSSSMTNIFSYNAGEDNSGLSSHASRYEPVQLSEENGSGSPGVVLSPTGGRVYVKEDIQLKREQYYLFRFKLKIEPLSEAVIVNAGFSAIGRNPENPEKKKSLRAYFAHTGQIRRDNPREGDNVFVFSNVVEWEDLSEKLDFEDNSGLVRPAIHVKSRSGNGKISLLSMSLDAL